MTFKQGDSRGCCLRRVRILKNGTWLRILTTSLIFCVTFKQGSSRGAASGGPEF